LSMSDMKHDAIVSQGIPIHERVPIPDEMIPEDGRVEIDAKIHAGYCECLRYGFLCIDAKANDGTQSLLARL
jgi:hypothetical protein